MASPDLHHLVKLTAAAAPFSAQEKNYKPIAVKTPDGLAIAAQEWGNPAGPEILFIHGFSQSHLSWSRQVESDLAKEFRIVTYDLRGHGGSDKPFEPERYKESKFWADEVQAVIDAAGLKRPLQCRSLQLAQGRRLSALQRIRPVSEELLPCRRGRRHASS